MRRFNAIITALIFILFLVHAILGSFQLIGIGKPVSAVVAYVFTFLVAVHLVIGVKLTVDTFRTQKKAGVSYFKENKLFWARRISGLAVIILLVFHFFAFSYNADVTGATRLHVFDIGKLITQIILILAVALHVITNVRPMMITFGIKSLKRLAFDVLFVLSVLLVFMGIAMIIYYLRWSVW